MKALELKIPPPVVLLVVAAAMWAVSWFGQPFNLDDSSQTVLAGSIAIIGAGIDIFCVISFWRAKTTVNPLRPRNSSALVTSGAYRFSRNPMYLGQALIVAAWAVFLSTAWAYAGPALFVLYLNRYQIAPEEKVLAKMFGGEYLAYRARVRRWM